MKSLLLFEIFSWRRASFLLAFSRFADGLLWPSSVLRNAFFECILGFHIIVLLGGDKEAAEAHVESDHRQFRRVLNSLVLLLHVRNLICDGDIEAPALSHLHGDGLDFALDEAVSHAAPDPSHFRETDFIPFVETNGSVCIAGPVGVLASALLLEGGEADLAALPLALLRPEEILQGCLEVGPGCGESSIVALLEVFEVLLEGGHERGGADVGAVLLPLSVCVLIPPEALVVHRAGAPEEHSELLFLLHGGVDAI